MGTSGNSDFAGFSLDYSGVSERTEVGSDNFSIGISRVSGLEDFTGSGVSIGSFYWA